MVQEAIDKVSRSTCNLARFFPTFSREECIFLAILGTLSMMSMAIVALVALGALHHFFF